LRIFFILTFFKFIFKNNISKILFADLTLLATPAHVARQDNVAASHAAARQAHHAGTVGSAPHASAEQRDGVVPPAGGSPV
jgi:hypothetical protein